MAKQGRRPLSLEEEKRLVERLQRGDTAALEPLWRAYAELLFAAVIFPALPTRELAEEVLQNTFLKALERIHNFTWQERGILPWLKTIARNMTMDVHRRHRRTEHFCQGYGHYVDAAEIGSSTAQQRPDAALSERQQRDQTQQRVRAVLDSGQFNERYKQAIELRLFKDVERERCAEMMGIKVGTFDVLFHRAVKRFEALYRQRYGAPPQSHGQDTREK